MIPALTVPLVLLLVLQLLAVAAERADRRPRRHAGDRGRGAVAQGRRGEDHAATDVGKPCFIVDDHTVAKTDGTGTRSIAGFIEQVDDQSVWLRFDEVVARAYVAGITLPEGD